MAYAQLYLAVAILTVLIIVGIWDVYAIASGNPDFTVSTMLRDWSRISPIVPVFVGMLVGHIWLCTCSPREAKKVDDIRKEIIEQRVKPP